MANSGLYRSNRQSMIAGVMGGVLNDLVGMQIYYALFSC